MNFERAIKQGFFIFCLVLAAGLVYIPVVWVLNYGLFGQTQTAREIFIGLFAAVFFVLLFSYGRQFLQKITNRKKYSAKMVQSMERAIFELQETNKELERLDQAKSEFISVVSHQLRTPVTLIRGVSSMLKEGDLDKLSPGEQKNFIDGLWQKSNKLEKIVKDILRASEVLTQSKTVFKKKAGRLDLFVLLQDIVVEFRLEAQARGTEISCSAFGSPAQVLGDWQAVKEALAAIIDNAIKYTPSLKATAEARAVREIPGKIEIELKKKKDSYIISVKDNGIGIKDADKEEIFKSFVRGKNANQAYTDGSGLGLYIAREIIESHGGRIWFEGEENKGVTFFISLPALK